MTDDAEGRRRGPLEFCLGILVSVVLFVMMAITFADVTGRYFLGRPLPAAYEMTEILLAVCVFGAMPLTTLGGDHIRLSLLDRFFVGRVDRIRNVAASLFCGLASLGLAIEVFSRAIRMFSRGDHTLYLKAPLAPVALFIAILAAATAIAFLYLAVSRAKVRLGREY